MLKLFILIIILTFYSCDNPSSNEAQKNNVKTISNLKKENKKIIKKNSFEVIKFDKEIKTVYRSANLKKQKREINFSKLFKILKKKVLTVQFYVNFENFSSLPEIYRDKMNENNTFFISGIHIGDNYILTELNILKEANVIYIKDNKGINYLDIVGYDENYNVALLKSSKKINVKKIDILNIKNTSFLPGKLIFSLFSISDSTYSFRKHFVNFSHYSEFYEIIDALYSATISHIGNSGGIIFDSSGKFLGIVSLYDSYYENSGFIITNEIIKKILPQLKKGYQIRSNGWLGVYLKEKDQDVLVKKLVNKSPAMKAGIKVGDKIIKINNIKIKSKKNVKRIMSFINSGNTINLELIRNDKPVNVSIKIIDKPLEYLYKNNKAKTKEKFKRIGLKLINENNAIIVSEVEEGSLAFIYGIKMGDQLLEISGVKISSIKIYNDLINNLKKNKNIRVKLLRGKEIKLIAFKKS